MPPVQLPRRNVSTLLSTFRPPREPDDINALPIEDSADEFCDSSGDDAADVADLKRTAFEGKTSFKTANATDDQQASVKTRKALEAVGRTQQRRSTCQIGSSSSRKRAKEEIEDDEADENDFVAIMKNKKVKTAKMDPVAKIGSHIQPDGWLPEARQKPAAVKYGKKGAKSNASTPQKFRHVSKYSDVGSPGSPARFKNPGESQHDDSSPVPDPKSSKLSRLSKTQGSEREGSEAPSDPPRPLGGCSGDRKPSRRQFKRVEKGAMTPEPISQRPEFKMPKAYDDYAPDADLTGFNMSFNETPVDHKKRSTLYLGEASCPMCDVQVDAQSLKEFSNGERMTIAQQIKFCRMHKKTSAQRTWKEKGYPNIDWTLLATRIEGHHDYIESVIRGKVSHFGDVLRDKIKTGQDRTLRQTEEYPTPGYYGLRGMSLMTETIVETFSNLLRQRAPRDKIISARGYTGFVQSVLVPELAVKLIQEDMSLGANEAREVMRESRAAGEILNDEKRESRKQIQVDDESADDGAEISEGHGDKSDEDAPGKPMLQMDADSDSELSSIASMGGKENEIETRGPAKTWSLVVDDSDSDLSSVGDL